ncbi:SGNH/GDSL hydrolase family protein [Aeromicrobium sp.]|uniref:SGNH/GDSL hydrolase family protein n=1 Tax=Aeromicrobium sp. TaxID=1871063 RepID=UPI0030BFB8B9
MTQTSFDYSNLSGRPTGPVIALAGRFLRGVREVQSQVEPYAHEWERHNRLAVAAAGPMWVVLGDSMAQGIGAGAYDRGWAGQLAGSLPNHRLVNLSVSGGRVSDLLERQIPAMDSLGAQPDLVTVIVGSNDLISRRMRVGLSQRVEELLRRLPRGSVIATLPEGRPGADEFNRLLDEAAGAGDIVVADFRNRSIGSWKGKLAQDRFHPNDAGYAGMAETMREAITGR